MKKIIVLGIFIVGFMSVNFSTEIATYKNRVQYVSVEKATKLLSTTDDYTNSLSQFDLNARLHKQKATKAEQLKNTISQLREWTVKDKERINSMLDIIDKSITDNGFKINFPKDLYFIKSTMQDEGGADGYTRGTCIVFSEAVPDMTDAQLKQVLVHELFHVLTRNDSEFKREMYGIIGFKLMNKISYPSAIKEFKMSNPDAPNTDSYIILRKDDSDVECAMILYSQKEYTTGNFFDYISIGFLKVKGTGKKEIEYVDGKPVIYSFGEVKNFIEQVGKNTEYIIDPEEIMADNFSFAILNKRGLPSQWLIDKILADLKN